VPLLAILLAWLMDFPPYLPYPLNGVVFVLFEAALIALTVALSARWRKPTTSPG
jgi:hypothetical protein